METSHVVAADIAMIDMGLDSKFDISMRNEIKLSSIANLETRICSNLSRSVRPTLPRSASMTQPRNFIRNFLTLLRKLVFNLFFMVYRMDGVVWTFCKSISASAVSAARSPGRVENYIIITIITTTIIIERI
jgi:hypothetical protein